ncbi:MAG: efflux RND transporter periplasmic adaptor subunit [Rhodocyclaceae bacterium]|nr:efflux RND transporter periplasmic adaptor subunit [Rhodocyclaceae bacterium]
MQENTSQIAAKLALAAASMLLLVAPALAEPLVLQAAQVKSLGIETAAIADLGNIQGGRFPARVLVPNDQVRVVAAPVGGMIEMLAVAPGDSVKRGQLLARLASPQALELQRDVLQSSSQAQLLSQNLKRDETLFSEGLIPESRLQATRAAAAQAAALASERRQGLGLAGVTPGKLGGPLQLAAPIDGVVLEQGVQTGERVDSAALIYRIARLSPLWLEIQAPVELAATLKPGATLRLAQGDTEARLLAIGRAIDPASQTVLLRAEVRQGAENLRPGQMVEVVLAGAAEPRRISVPAAALARHDNKEIIFVVLKEDTRELRVEARTVRVLAQGGNSVQVEGLDAQSRIVVKGASALKALMAGVGRQ